MIATLKSFDALPLAEDAGGKSMMNVPDNERKVSTAMGAAMLITGIFLRGVSRWAVGTFGLALMGRGFSGYCPVYHLRHENRRPVIFRGTAG